MTEWIKVTDRLPEFEQEVLAYRESVAGEKEIIISYLSWMLDSEPIWADEVSDYSHWMPLPEPPND